nr:hypothetical protein [uncultured Methanolobus sp.]
MNINEYPACLRRLANDHVASKYIESSCKSELYRIASELETSLKMKKKKVSPSWNIKINRDKPLVFISNKKNLQVDVCCEIKGEGDTILKQNVELRIWSLNQSLSYRDKIDSDHLKIDLESANWKRVISRFHFDLRSDDAKLPEPICHLQVGGDSGTCLPNGGQLIKENCWHPPQLSVPRFFHVPFDIILISEFILTNFFPIESMDLRKKPEWIKLIKKSEEFFCRVHIENYLRYLEDENQTLLGNLAR